MRKNEQVDPRKAKSWVQDITITSVSGSSLSSTSTTTTPIPTFEGGNSIPMKSTGHLSLRLEIRLG